jgi:hypothetical protein
MGALGLQGKDAFRLWLIREAESELAAAMTIRDHSYDLTS